MALSCIPKSVVSGASCTENPAGLGNYLFAVPLDNIGSIAANDEKNQYDITPKATAGESAPAKAALKGYRIDYKSQTGQYTSDDNGTGKAWSGTATGRVEALRGRDGSHQSRPAQQRQVPLLLLYGPDKR